MKAKQKRHHKRGEEHRRERRDFHIIYEDQDLIVVLKEAGVLSVPFKGGRARNLLDLVKNMLERKHERALVVHRIDRFTSGLLVFAKNKRAREGLVAQFRAHTPRREYIALVRGAPPAESGELKDYLRLSKDGFRQQVVRNRKDGDLAHLKYRVVASSPEISLVRVRLVTGLKNQIRVQFVKAGCPIVGDRHYAGYEEHEQGIKRQALHAVLLGFRHPITDEYLEFIAPPTKDMHKLMHSVGMLWDEKAFRAREV